MVDNKGVMGMRTIFIDDPNRRSGYAYPARDSKGREMWVIVNGTGRIFENSRKISEIYRLPPADVLSDQI